MDKGLDILFSKYIIDGSVMESTPADMLGECSLKLQPPGTQPDTVIDESPDRDPSPLKYRAGDWLKYLEALRPALARTGAGHHPVSVVHPASSARILLAEAVLDCLWRRKPLKLEDLVLSVSAVWDCAPVGHMAAFHRAVESVTGYAYDLGVRFGSVDIRTQEGAHEMNFGVVSPELSGGRAQRRLADVPDSVLIYVPFDTCAPKLGGSLLSGVIGRGDENSPDIIDPDYFMDCFEVVHELVEDGVVTAGATVGRGGLIAAVDRILGDDWRIELDINGVQRAYMMDDPVRALFAETPGILIQIRREDGSYTDSQFLLQDIAYYDVGRPVRAGGTKPAPRRRISLAGSSRAELSRILSALINGPMPEDPDISNFSEGSETERRSGE